MKKIYLFILTLLCSATIMYAQQPDVQVVADSIVAWRHHIHQNPELSYKEYKTSKYVADRLRSFGNIEVSQPTETSVIGVLRSGKPGRTVGFRADMDALPVEEQTGFPFSSQVTGVSHACGHDMHTAMLLGTAKVLSGMQSKLRGTIYFIFQHAEEQAPGGAKGIIASGALKGVEAIFGAHVIPNYPVGSIGILPSGPASTAADGFMLKIKGKGSHGSKPQEGIDPIVTGAEVVMMLQTVASRSVEPGEMAVLSIGKFQSGNAPNVIPEVAELAASIRTVTPETRKLIEERVRTVVDNVCKANGATYDLNYVLSYPAIQNDAKLRELAREAAIKAVGEKNVFEVPMLSASEDFSYYADVAPTYFLIIGVGDGVANHNPAFKADDGAMLNGVKTEVQVIIDFLNQGVK